MYCLFVGIALLQSAGALECGTWITNECLGSSDRRYDPNYPIGLIDQDSRWKRWEGLWSVVLTSYGSDGRIMQPELFDPLNPGGSPYKQEGYRAFYNHSFFGSRFTMERYYVFPPPDPSFCNQTFAPPKQNTLSRGGGACGVNGIALSAGGFGTSTHEKNGDMELFKGHGMYGTSVNAIQQFLDDRTVMAKSGARRTQINMNVLVYLNDVYSLLSGSVSQFQYGQNAGMLRNVVLTMTKVTEAAFIQGIRDAYTDFNVLPADQVQNGVLPTETVSLDASAYPTEAEWCQTDPSCSTSPYQEPEATHKAGVIAAFVITVAVLIIGGLLILHWYRMKQQAHRYRDRFIRRLAEHIHIEGHKDALTEEQLAEEFKRIDVGAKGGDGYIQREELKEFMMTGKAGKISESDFNAMWVALDFDHNGKVDFIEFCTFLSRCGGEYDQVAAEQNGMKRDDLHQSVSQKISRKGTTSLSA